MAPRCRWSRRRRWRNPAVSREPCACWWWADPRWTDDHAPRSACRALGRRTRRRTHAAGERVMRIERIGSVIRLPIAAPDGGPGLPHLGWHRFRRGAIRADPHRAGQHDHTTGALAERAGPCPASGLQSALRLHPWMRRTLNITAIPATSKNAGTRSGTRCAWQTFLTCPRKAGTPRPLTVLRSRRLCSHRWRTPSGVLGRTRQALPS